MDDLKEHTKIERSLIVKANQKKVPITANFELTPKCNLNCDMCYIRMPLSNTIAKNSLLTVDEWLNIAESFKKKGTLFILLTGGEPLLYPNFSLLYMELRKMGFILTINTNATLINKEHVELFSQYTPRRINVTLYGINSDTYKTLCHNASGYNRCLRGLNLLKHKKIDIKLNVSAVNKNVNDISAILTYARQIDLPVTVDSYMFPLSRSICSYAKNILNARLSPSKAAEIESIAIKYKEQDNYNAYIKELRDSLILTGSDYLPLGLDCRAGKSSCWINWQGNMSPCVAMEEPSISLKEHSVDEAWNYIVEESQKLEKHSECAGCKLRPICNVCYAAACHEKKAVGNLSHLCEMAQWKKKFLLEE